jgi:hypothetical protein
MAVGNNKYTGKGFAQTWNGTEWKILFEGYAGELKGISCPSTTWCMMITKSENGAWRLKSYEGKGTQWSTESSSPYIPTGATQFALRGVSCTAEAACTAVGSYYLAGYNTIAERWNGSSWSQQSTPNPGEGSAASAMLDVSCATATSCVAVGTTGTKPFAERWNGSEWSLGAAVNPGGSVESSLEGASCSSSSFCVAVGSYRESTGSAKTLTEHWNGSKWSIVASPNPTGAKGSVKLAGVSCLSASSCSAVGGYVSKKEGKPVEAESTLVEAWNGAEWAVQSSPNAEGMAFSILSDVSCTTAIQCTAVGSERPGVGANGTVTLAERYE